MAALIDATTGYPGDIADWTDTTPQPDSADSGAHLYSFSSWASFIVPSFSLIPAETGYSTIADWFDTTPQPNFADSLASLMDHYESGYGIIEGRYLVPDAQGSKETWGIIGE